MKTVTSVSGGKTSAYLAAKYPTDHNVFALVRTEDQDSRFKDEVLRKRVEDRIQADFIATAEDDIIITTMFDLEQYLGREIKWVTGITFDEVIRTKGGWLPNKLHRYCTTWLKITPIFYWWSRNFDGPIQMNIGYRANEGKRVNKMNNRLNENGFLDFKATFERWVGGSHDGKNKWETIEWQKPNFPLYEDRIFPEHIHQFWEFKPVQFAPMNNCVHCFHRSPLLLNKLSKEHPEKMNWAARQEGGKNGNWRADLSYQNIIDHEAQLELSFDDFSECDSGYCGY